MYVFSRNSAQYLIDARVGVLIGYLPEQRSYFSHRLGTFRIVLLFPQSILDYRCHFCHRTARGAHVKSMQEAASTRSHCIQRTHVGRPTYLSAHVSGGQNVRTTPAQRRNAGITHFVVRKLFVKLITKRIGGGERCTLLVICDHRKSSSSFGVANNILRIYSLCPGLSTAQIQNREVSTRVTRFTSPCSVTKPSKNPFDIKASWWASHPRYLATGNPGH